jgi:hypothetical protein
MLNGQALRNFAFALLDDEYGINGEAWESLHQMLEDDDQEDIIDAVKATEGRYYLTAETANKLRPITVN